LKNGLGHHPRRALAADHKVVATDRDTDKVAEAVGESANLMVVKLDVTNPADAESAGKGVIDRVGRIDVLVNNAASFFMQAILRKSHPSAPPVVG
jgi:NAD(P)-dependent dehydrogenase (short-subunit alcohol dehydrogenase family)